MRVLQFPPLNDCLALLLPRALGRRRRHLFRGALGPPALLLDDGGDRFVGLRWGLHLLLGSGCRRFGPKATCAEARAQSFRLVDHLGAVRQSLAGIYLDDLLARDLTFDRGEDSLAFLVLEAGRIVRFLGDLLDQLERQLKLGRRRLDVLDLE